MCYGTNDIRRSVSPPLHMKHQIDSKAKKILRPNYGLNIFENKNSLLNSFKYHLSIFEVFSLSFISLISRFCLYIWPINERWKGEDGLEGNEDEGLGAA